MHAAEFPLLSVGQFGLLAAQFPPGAGDGHALAGADEIGFELGEGGEDIEEQLSHRIARVVEGPAEGQFNVSFPKPIGDGARIWDGPGQPVEFRHDQRVACAHGGEGLVEAGAGAGGAGETVIGVDAILGDAQLQERLALGRRILPVGGTARVSDERCRHGRKCTDRVPLPQLFPYHSYETLLAPVWRGSGRPTAPSAGRSPYGQRRACRDERITERWNMPRRSIWSARQRAALFDLPTDEAALLRHYTLSDDDIEHIRVRRGGHNRLGFALQLCAFRYPGRLLVVGEAIPLNVLRFIAAQLGRRVADLDGYAVREETRREHLAEIRRSYGYRMFSGRCARDLKVWFENEAEAARSNEGLARRFVEECRRRQVILPGSSVLERLCADALVAAERRIETRIAAGLDDAMRLRLDRLLTEEVDGGVSRFVWLRRFEVGRNSADINGLLDRLEFLQGFDLPSDLLETVPPHRIARLRRQGERYFTDGLRDISGDRRLAILAVCAVEWRGAIADAVVETHDRIVGQTFRSAKRRCDARIQDSRTVLHDTLAAFRTLGAALLEAKGDGAPLEEAVAAAGGWQKLEGVVAAAEQLSDTMSADPLAHVVQGWPPVPALCAAHVARARDPGFRRW